MDLNPNATSVKALEKLNVTIVTIMAVESARLAMALGKRVMLVNNEF